MNAASNDDATVDVADHLRQADALLTEGVRRIMHASGDLPGASHPLHEVLRLSEQQAMATLEAAENVLSEARAIRARGRGADIEVHVARIEALAQDILTSQQAQDLGGQRLKKAITLLQAVEHRIGEVLTQLGLAPIDQPAAWSDAPALEQSHVDELLAHLGI